MRLAVMPRTRERSEWSGHGVDGQTAPAKTAPQPAGAKNREPHRKHGAGPEQHRDRGKEPLRALRDTSR